MKILHQTKLNLLTINTYKSIRYISLRKNDGRDGRIMTIEEYLSENAFRWKIHGDTEMNGERIAIVSEFSPKGNSSGPFALLEKNGQIFNLEIGEELT